MYDLRYNCWLGNFRSKDPVPGQIRVRAVNDMGAIKLFRMRQTEVDELPAASFALERSLQTIIEKHLEDFFGVRFLVSEQPTGHGGRIDTLGIDEDGSPVIIEYKRALNENVINQGLYYLDWLLQNKAEFALLVRKQFGLETADNVEWSSPRLLCIAGDFAKFDVRAVQQIDHNIDLIRYKRYGEDLLLFELVNSTVAEPIPDIARIPPAHGPLASAEVRDRFEALKAFLVALGDEVTVKQLRSYVAFRRLKNFACVQVRLTELVVIAKVDPNSISLEEGFTRDVSNVGHFAPGPLEIRIKSDQDLEKAKPLLLRSYESD